MLANIIASQPTLLWMLLWAVFFWVNYSEEKTLGFVIANEMPLLTQFKIRPCIQGAVINSPALFSKTLAHSSLRSLWAIASEHSWACWTSEVFYNVITLDTYHFQILNSSSSFTKDFFQIFQQQKTLFSKIRHYITQCLRMDLNKMSRPEQKTTAG